MNKAKSKAPHSGELYIPPQPMFAPCPQCHALTLKGQDGAMLTPALGLAHVCEPTTTNEGR